jgi:TrmH family RNA methyltransferase
MGSADTPLSLRNPRVQHLRRLVGRRRARSEAGQFVFEGPALLIEAVDAGLQLDGVFVDEEAGEEVASLADVVDDRVERWMLARGVLSRIADTKTPQGVMVLARRPPTDFTQLERSGSRGLLFVLHGINDPGNAGAVVRTAEAVAATAVVFARGGTDPFGPKAVRAAAGSAFRLPLYEAGATMDVLGELQRLRFTCIGATAAGGDDYRSVDLSGDVVLVLGSEAHGLDAEVEAGLDQQITIPMRGEVESLNVATAAAVLGFERARQLDAADGSR